MDKRLLIIIGIFILGSASLFGYRKIYYKPEGIRYTIKPINAIKTGDSIAFNDQTSGASRWKWDFGDGEFSADQAGNHTYLTAGTFPVTLTVYGPFGTQQKTNTVTVIANNATVAAAGPSIVGPADAKAGVSATWGSSITAASYDWKVEGEQAPAQKGTTATYAFKSAGRHTLVLNMHTPDNIIRRDIMVVAADQPAPKPVAAAAPVHAAPQHAAAQPAKPKPAHHEAGKKGNALEDLGDGEVIKK